MASEGRAPGAPIFNYCTGSTSTTVRHSISQGIAELRPPKGNGLGGASSGSPHLQLLYRFNFHDRQTFDKSGRRGAPPSEREWPRRGELREPPSSTTVPVQLPRPSDIR